ncbi:MAG TPA: stage V sporulation protein B [Peptococcaceae bacterium]|nr:MAG: Polysaccharide biosynthesis protein [Moorella sp. 60_41]HBT47672.1 stage V sporulation protein B [Peptococcaceae bacterium]
MAARVIWQGAAVLVMANLFNRLLSFAYRILVIRLIGAEGMGLYEMVFPFYTLVLVVATAGIPVALAKMVAERAARGEWSGVRGVFRLSFWFLTLSGVFFTSGLYWAAPYLSQRVFADDRVFHAFTAMLAALPLVCIASAFRGYFQGLQFMYPLALAQVAEQVVRVTGGLWLAVLLLPRGIEWAAAGLAWGMVLGEAVGLLTNLVIFRRARPYYELEGGRAPGGGDLLPLLRLAVPVTLARAAGGIMLTLEALLIPRQLQVWGASMREATTLYGHYSGIAMTLVYLPMIVTVAVAMVMVPAMAEAQALKNYALLHRRCDQALRITILTGLPFALGFYFLGAEICHTVFKTPEAALPLKALAWGCLFLYLQQTTGGILNGLGAVKTVLFTTFVDGVVDILAVYFLVPLWGIAGAAWGVNLGSGVSTLLNLAAIARLTGWRPEPVSAALRPLAAAAVLGVVLKVAGDAMGPWVGPWRLPGVLLGGGAVYLAALFLTGAVSSRYLSFWKWM